ncbi:hypothetical protein [Acinetobacter larvae]|uniref:Uncharacterized protein n=1 Tax=Acinetobacter larvae TaxID=1789224 RepID=A0A1B2M2C6_9GAMM|nr:hypothetical protein [Acinetobacter larvae]AOA59350.1 hypothetical protein BFG52_13950 [Acinetobacter larvae]
MRPKYAARLISSLALSLILLTGCNPKDASDSAADKSSASAAIKDFQQTADDPHDIAQLIQFEKQIKNLTHDIEKDLQLLAEQQKMSQELLQQRQHDFILSALNLLKSLDLRTEQGRYIQALYATHWDEQLHHFSENPTPVSNSANLSAFTTGDAQQQAHQQLQKWQSQQKK